MKTFIYSMVFILCSQPVSAQTYSGKIIDQFTYEPLVGATILNKKNKEMSVSNHLGFFTIHAEENDSLIIQFFGYSTLETTCNSNLNLFQLSYTKEAVEPITITANRSLSSRSQSPISISLLSPQLIDETKASSVYEIINKAPGVNMVNLGNEQHMMSIRQPITTNSYFLYLEDGIPIRPLGIFNHNALLEINPFTIHSIEVVKGPVSSIYGAEAIGGAINFISQKPTAIPTAKLGFQMDQFGYNRMQFGVGGRIKKLGVYVGGINSIQTNSWMAHSDYEKSSYNLRIDYEFNENNRIIYTGIYNNYYSEMSGSIDSIAFYNRTYKSTNDFTYRKSLATRSKITFEHNWKSGSLFHITLFQRFNQLEQNPSYSIRWTPKSTTASGQINSNNFKSYGFVAQHTQKFNFLKSTLLVGATFDFSPNDYWAYQIDLNAKLRPDSLSVEQYSIIQERPDIQLANYKALIHNSGSYIQYTLEPIQNLKISMGGRYDIMSFTYHNYMNSSLGQKSYQQFTPKIGATYSINKNIGVYGNYSQGFAPPGLTAIFRPKPNSNPIAFYTDLVPASFENYELGGWTSFFKKKVLLDISIYQMQGENELLSIKQADNSTDYQSAGKTLHQGIELGVLIKPIQKIHFRFGGTVANHQYIDFKISEKENDLVKNLNNKIMPSAPKTIWNTELAYYPSFLKKMRMTLEWQYVSSYYQNQINTIKYTGYHLFNFRVGYKWKGLEIYTNVMNIANSLYATNATRGNFETSTSTYTASAPRTFIFGLQYHFNGKP
jgi:iron complex outermembrane recepter protein